MNSLRLRSAIFCPAILILCVAVSYPVAATGLVDDWSYMWSARVLASTGHIVYNGWATAMLGWQLYLGALTIKLFGFSFTALRVSMLCLSAATTILIQRCLLRCGLSEWNATLATLALATSPLFLPLAFSFMSDVPGLFAIVLCFYGCLRALQSSTTRGAYTWLIVSAFLNTATGTVRQIAWLGTLVMVPCAFWLLRRRRLALPLGIVVWLANAAIIFACLRWYSQQPYSLVEPLFALNRSVSLPSQAADLLRDFLHFAFIFLPIGIVFLLRYPWRMRAGQAGAALYLLLITAGAVILHRHGHADVWLAPFDGVWVSPRGLVNFPVLLGQRPDLFSTPLRIALTLLTVASICGFAAFVATLPARRQDQTTPSTAISWPQLLILLAPFSLAYLFLLVTRAAIYDRYDLPLIFVALAITVRLYQQSRPQQSRPQQSHPEASRLPALCIAAIALFAAAGTAGMHDLFAMTRARLLAVKHLEDAGIPRGQIRAGFEEDALYQLNRTGYVNDYRLKIPANAFHDTIPPAIPRECMYINARWTPDIHAVFGLAYTPTPCYPSAAFPPVRYTTWFGPHDQAVYTLTLTP